MVRMGFIGRYPGQNRKFWFKMQAINLTMWQFDNLTMKSISIFVLVQEH